MSQDNYVPDNEPQKADSDFGQEAFFLWTEIPPTTKMLNALMLGHMPQS